MDILTQLAHHYWGWIGEFPRPVWMLLLRWASILLALFLFGMAARYLTLRLVVYSLPFQVAAFVFGFVTGMSLPLGRITLWDYDVRNTLITGAILTWLALPYFLPSALIRTRGIQGIVRPLIYLAEVILLIIQLAVLKGD